MVRHIFAHLARPLAPVDAEVEPRLPSIEGIRCVLFDVYGTLVISGSGDVGTTARDARSTAMVEAISAVGLSLAEDGETALADFFATIDRFHANGRAAGVEYPEVDIREVWTVVLEQWKSAGRLSIGGREVDVEQLAAHYEARANPTWPMPGGAECLAQLAARRLTLGIVSNAQFYTPAMMTALFGRPLDALGFDPSLRYYSYEFRVAKPSVAMYELARDALAARGVAAGETLYVGNDMLNDIGPAAQVGFRTALFAGDARSVRWRSDDPRVASATPDAALTTLSQLPDCLTTP